MKFFSIITLALILSAFTQHASAQKQTQQPPIDSIAYEALMDALTIWDQPQFFEPFGFRKVGNSSISSLIGVDKGTLLQVDRTDTTAEISLIYSHWGGHWKYTQSRNGDWYEKEKDYSSSVIPEIDEFINPFIQGLNTAALQSDLAWLQGSEFAGILDSLDQIVESMKEQGQRINSIWGIEGDYAYEFDEDTIYSALSALSNFAIKMADTVMAKNSGADILYFEVQSKSIKGVIHINENGYELNSVNTQSTDTTFIITWGNVTLMPHPSEMEKITKASWMLQFFFPGDIGVLVSLENEITTPGVIFFSGMDHIGTYVNNDWTAEDPNYNIGDLQKIFLDCQSLLPKQ